MMTNVAITTAASPNVLLVTAGEYSCYGVDTVLLVPVGRNEIADVIAYRAMLVAECRRYGDDQEGVEELEKWLKSANRNRLRIAKYTPERAMAWQHCQRIRQEYIQKARECNQAQYRAMVELCRKYMPEYKAIKEPDSDKYLCMSYICPAIDSGLMVGWLVRELGYKEILWIDSQNIPEKQ